MVFTPQVDDVLTIDGRSFRFLRHPATPKIVMVWEQTGRFGTVYALAVQSNGKIVVDVAGSV